jgi:hypothetical protein
MARHLGAQGDARGRRDEANAAVVETLADKPTRALRRSRTGDSAARRQTPEALLAHHKAGIDKW